MSGFLVPRVGGYLVERKIGSGSSGLVYAAVQEETHLDVVVKSVTFSNPWLHREFEREVNNLTLLGPSPYIVKMFDHFEQNTQGIIILERMRIDLLEYMECSQLSELEVKQVFYQVCKGVEHAHNHNVAHMDIKPENIFIDSPDRVKLADFGSSCVWKPGTHTVIFSQIGTQFYCAPEVVSYISFAFRFLFSSLVSFGLLWFLEIIMILTRFICLDVQTET
jgi:serine/threonine protein kinase